MGEYRIYDKEEETWLGVSFYEFDCADDYVINNLSDSENERYAIYKLICG